MAKPRIRQLRLLLLLCAIALALATLGCGSTGATNWSQEPPPPPPGVAVSISPATASIAPSGTRQFNATVTGSPDTSVTWTATGGTISGNGLYTAPGNTGTFTVRATSVADTTKFASATVTVTTSPPPSGGVAVSITPASVSVPTGGTEQFTATVSGTSNTAVTWSATGGTVSNSGLYTAPNAPGTFTVRATSVADTTKSGTATVTVSTPGQETAHLWIDGSGTCTRNSFPAAYNSATACASFDAANDVAQNGDLVLVKGGTYAGQGISGFNGRTAAAAIRSAAGESVTLTGDLDITGRFLVVQGESAANPITLTNNGDVDLGTTPIVNHFVTVKWVNGRSVFIRGCQLNLLNGIYGNFDNTSGSELDGMKITYDSATNTPSCDILIEGNTFENVRRTSGSFHTDTIQLMGGRRITIRNNILYNGPTEHIIARPQAGGAVPIEDLVIENNFFGPVLDGTQSINIGSAPDRCSNVIIQNNTVAGGVVDIDCAGPGGGASTIIRGNILGSTAGCDGDAICSHNVFKTGVAMQGSNAVQCNPSYVNPARFNYRLRAGDTCAINRAHPTDFPSTDIDGQGRTSPAEAGADELSSSTTAETSTLAATGNGNTSPQPPTIAPSPASVAFSGAAATTTSLEAIANNSGDSGSPRSPGPTRQSALPTVQHHVDLSWNATSAEVAGYNVYRGTKAGGPYTKLNSALQGTTNYTDGSVQPGLTYFYVVSAVDVRGAESNKSNETVAVIPTF